MLVALISHNYVFTCTGIQGITLSVAGTNGKYIFGFMYSTKLV